MDFKGPNLNKCANSCPSITYKNQERMRGDITIIIIWKEIYALLSQDGVWYIVNCIEWWLLLLCFGALFNYLWGGLPHFFYFIAFPHMNMHQSYFSTLYLSPLSNYYTAIVACWFARLHVHEHTWKCHPLPFLVWRTDACVLQVSCCALLRW